MNRLAIFVEGETEQLFAEWFVREMAGDLHLHVQPRKARGGISTRHRTRFVRAEAVDPGVQFYVLIVDCGSDGGVKTRIVEEYANLARQGYGGVIGLRDAPQDRSEIPRLRLGLPAGVSTDPLPVVFVLSVMEIEAWFLAEHTHFEKIDAGLTPELINDCLHFYPGQDDMRDRDTPARDLDEAYALVGKRYQKGRAALRTVLLLDCTLLAVELAERDEDFALFTRMIADFFMGDRTDPAPAEG